MANASSRMDLFSPSARSYETLAALRASAFRNLETSVMADIGAGDGRSLNMDITENTSYLPNLSIVDQYHLARRTLGGHSDDDSSIFDAGDMAETFSKTHFRLLLDEDPGWKATEALFGDFLRFVLLFPGQHEVFELLRHFEELCLDQTLILQKIMDRGAPGNNRYVRTYDMFRYVQAELWTWRLIRLMYEDRYDKRTKQKSSELTEEEVRSLTDSEKWKYLYDNHVQFRELRLIVEWCQQNASDSFNLDDTDVFEGKTFLWEQTLFMLKTGKDMTARKLIHSMDPDAPIREGARLDDSDEADEQRLLSLVFCHVRAGQLDKAADLCVRSGQSWRSATLKSALPYHRRRDQQTAKVETAGNASRDIWKRMTWQFCENPSLPLAERAIYGALCGHFASMRSAGGSWEDALWAHAIAASEQIFDDFLRRTATKKRKLAELPPTSTLNQKACSFGLEEILEALEDSRDEKVSAEAKKIFRRLQLFVLLDKPGEVITCMHDYIAEQAGDIPKHMVRMMAHIVLIFKLCALEIPEAFANGVLELYVRILIEDQRADLVAFYTATLPLGSQKVWYAKFLEDVEGKEKRLHHLSLAEKAGLIVPEICMTIVRNVRDAFEPATALQRSFLSASTDSGAMDGIEDQWTLVAEKMTAEVPEREAKLIDAIEWLLFDTLLHGEAIAQSNAFARIFLIGGNLSAAKKLFDSLPADILQSATDAWLAINESDDNLEQQQLSAEHENLIREFLCHLAYLEAHSTFLQWFERYHRKKQPQLTAFSDAGSASLGATPFQRRAAAELKEKRNEEDLKLLERDLQSLAEVAVKAGRKVLLYPDGGWMVDQGRAADAIDEVMDIDRQEELLVLRKRCLPLIADMLITVLEGSGRYREALQVADIIVAEEYGLYQVFKKDQLKHINRRLAEVSRKAMDRGYDCLGYE